MFSVERESVGVRLGRIFFFMTGPLCSPRASRSAPLWPPLEVVAGEAVARQQPPHLRARRRQIARHRVQVPGVLGEQRDQPVALAELLGGDGARALPLDRKSVA